MYIYFVHILIIHTNICTYVSIYLAYAIMNDAVLLSYFLTWYHMLGDDLTGFFIGICRSSSALRISTLISIFHSHLS